MGYKLTYWSQNKTVAILQMKFVGLCLIEYVFKLNLFINEAVIDNMVAMIKVMAWRRKRQQAITSMG